MSEPSDPLTRAAAAARAFGLSLPEAVEEFPWGEPALKVRKKVFVFLGRAGDRWRFSVKLPASSEDVRSMPFAEPTGYGLGKSGWVSVTFGPDDVLPDALIAEWIDESYRAVAPKTLIKALDARPPG